MNPTIRRALAWPILFLIDVALWAMTDERWRKVRDESRC